MSKRYKLIKMLFLLITLSFGLNEVPFFSCFSSWSLSLSSVHVFHANITQVVLPWFQSLWHRVYAKLTHFSLTTLYSQIDLLADGFSIKMNSTSWKLFFRCIFDFLNLWEEFIELLKSPSLYKIFFLDILVAYYAIIPSLDLLHEHAFNIFKFD